MSCRIILRLRIAPHVIIRVHPLQIALHFVGREEYSDEGVVVARVIVIELGHVISVLACVPFAGAQNAPGVALRAIGAVELVALYGSAGSGIVDTGDHTAQRVGEQEIGTGVVEHADEPTGKAIVILISERGACPIINVISRPKTVIVYFVPLLPVPVCERRRMRWPEASYMYHSSLVLVTVSFQRTRWSCPS